jgi:hypothetical protein
MEQRIQTGVGELVTTMKHVEKFRTRPLAKSRCPISAYLRYWDTKST